MVIGPALLLGAAEVVILEMFELFGSLGIVSWAKALESIILV